VVGGGIGNEVVVDEDILSTLVLELVNLRAVLEGTRISPDLREPFSSKPSTSPPTGRVNVRW
jgi:hypothetical protein